MPALQRTVFVPIVLVALLMSGCGPRSQSPAHESLTPTIAVSSSLPLEHQIQVVLHLYLTKQGFTADQLNVLDFSDIRIEGDYARIVAVARDPGKVEGFIAYLQRQDQRWTVLEHRPTFDPAMLDALGIPATLYPVAGNGRS